MYSKLSINQQICCRQCRENLHATASPQSYHILQFIATSLYRQALDDLRRSVYATSEVEELSATHVFTALETFATDLFAHL